MFGQHFSFLRRLVGISDGGTATTTATDDRRFWVRYPADLKSSVQLADYPGEDRVPARIRDISRGGVNLVLDQGFQPGQLLSFEMPATDDPEEVFQLLACVVRSIPEPNGQHSLGCVFSRELTEHDLFTFGARRVRHAPEDQRTWQRFPCQLQASFHLIGHEDEEARPASVSNISASGVGLEVKEAVEVGSLLNLHVVGNKGQERTLLTCVVHAVHHGDSDWQLGCNFIRELSESDFQSMQ